MKYLKRVSPIPFVMVLLSLTLVVVCCIRLASISYADNIFIWGLALSLWAVNFVLWFDTFKQEWRESKQREQGNEVLWWGFVISLIAVMWSSAIAFSDTTTLVRLVFGGCAVGWGIILAKILKDLFTTNETKK